MPSDWKAKFCLALIASLGMARTVGAQAQALPPRPPSAGTPIVRQAAQPAPSLATVVDNLDWDAQARGALMIVSADETFPIALPRGAKTGALGEQPQTLDATPAGTYATSAAASYYDRRLVGIKTVTVFAPTSMTVLNYERLPRPNPYAGLSAGMKLRLLESMFTEAQWATAASDEGIGAADLNPKESALFLSILPEPFVVEAQPEPGGSLGSGAKTTLTAEQRAMTRLKLQKRLDCSFLQGTRGTMSFGSDNGRADSSYNLRLPYAMPEFMRRGLDSGPGSHPDVFGVTVASVVPSHAKPSQLPSDWGVLDVSVALGSAKTVGALVSQIARQTGAHLYCDPRYADRSLILRGSSARAVDLLNALCRAVTGTWRRVGDAFVLTDDLVGLGVRHVKIDDWAEQNALFSSLLTENANKALSGKQYATIGWSNSDPFKPDDTLIAKLDAFVAQPAVPMPGSGPTNQSPTMPITELPQALQDHLKEQLASYRDYLSKRPDTGTPEPAVRSDMVKIGIQVQASYIVPGFGRMAANDLLGMDGRDDILAKPYILPTYAAAKPDLSALTLAAVPAARALLIDTKDPKVIAAMAAEARRRGLNQLWIVVPPGDAKLLEVAIDEGRKCGLAVRAVARLLRASPEASESTLDRNLFGETESQYVKRRNLQAHEILAVTGPIDLSSRMSSSNLAWWLRDGFVAMFLERGDFRRGTETERAAITAEVGRVAAVPGLAGIIIQDKASPGSEPPYTMAEGRYSAPFSGDFGMQMGYDDETRLDCLKKLGFDPIDLSPLPYGDGQYGIALPFFPDSGGVSQRIITNMDGRKPGDGDLWSAWTQFRHRRSVALVESVRVAVQSARAGLPILVHRYDDATNGHYNWYGSADKPAGSGAPTPSSASKTVPNAGDYVHNRSVHDRAFDESSIVFLPIPIGGISSFQGRQSLDETKALLAYLLKESAKWDGLVIDVGNASPDEALEFLGLLPMVEGK